MPKPVDRGRPPTSFPKHLLFRELLRRPRPRRPLDFRVECARSIALHVRALKNLEYSQVFEVGDEIELEQVSVSRITAELIKEAVFTSRGRAFASADEVLQLSNFEVVKLGQEVLDVLHVISPTFQRSDVMAWKMALKEGAQHASNVHEALAMYRSCDRVGMNASVYERPDRFFGLPTCELVDGQWFAYSAAVELVESMIRSPDG